MTCREITLLPTSANVGTCSALEASWKNSETCFSSSIGSLADGGECSTLGRARFDRGAPLHELAESERRLREPTHFANKLCDVADMTRVVVANRHHTKKSPPVFAHLARPSEGVDHV